MTDIEIAQSAVLRPIAQIAEGLGIPENAVERYGSDKAKIDPSLLENVADRHGKLVLVTAISPTPAGEGKTTTAIGLTDALNRLGKRAICALREPSLGPVFGMKGGAAGGGYAQVVPMEDINLHFTGDIHAITAANNLLAAMTDNHIYQGNSLGIDPRKIVWKRCMDMNDRQLRQIVSGLGGKTNGMPREDGFDITVASEVMAALCLSNGMSDLKARLGRMIVGYTNDDKPITAADLKAHGAMAALLRKAALPNLVQTLEHSPVFIHGGPFANIAHGCNSLAATRLAMKLGDYAVTEAGFGADLGAEKFLDIKCRAGGFRPSAVVVVATIRALKHHGGAAKTQLGQEDIEKLKKGLPNLTRHVDNIKNVFGLNCLVALNRFPTDTQAEIGLVRDELSAMGVKVALSNVWSEGGAGGEELAREVATLCETPSDFSYAYDLSAGIGDKLNAIAKRIYRADGVELTSAAKKQLKQIEKLRFGELPVCVAKTQYSFSDDAKLTGAPEGFVITVRGLKVMAGAGFVVALTGDIMTMPGLPAVPAAENIDISDDGVIKGLF